MKNKGFTLIELLAVIVILAIIALIAIPRILNVVETARKGAAESSAIGFIDAVEKYIVLHEVDKTKYPYDLKGKTLNVGVKQNETAYIPFLENIYAEEATNNVPNLRTFIELKGKMPDDGQVVVDDKGKVESATLKIDKYDVCCTEKTCKVDGCTQNINNNSENNGGNTSNSESSSNSSSNNVTKLTIDSCPGCVFAYTESGWQYSSSLSSTDSPTSLTILEGQYEEYYEDVISESGKNYFLGMKLDATGKVEKAYTCGIENNEAFCLEFSTDGSTYIANRTLLQSEKIFNNSCTNAGSYVECSGSVDAYADSSYVGIGAGSGSCYVGYGMFKCGNS